MSAQSLVKMFPLKQLSFSVDVMKATQAMLANSQIAMNSGV